MMSDKTIPTKGHHPFPWLCTECNSKEVYPLATDYTTTVKHEGVAFTIRVPDLRIPTCRKCGTQYFTIAEGDRIAEGLRAHVGILTREEIHQHRTEFSLTQQELADQVGIPVDTIARWEEGGMIQSRAEDNLLRRFFEFRDARRMLERRTAQPPVLSA